MSAAESRLVLSGALCLPKGRPIEPKACSISDCGRFTSGPACRARPRARSWSRSGFSSRRLAYVEGSVRDRHTSPSSLSKSSCCADIPTKPASSASASISSIRLCSALVGTTSLRVARSRPMVAVRMSEWPMNAARLGPSGSDSSAATYSSAVLQLLCLSTAAITCRRGIASTRPNRSPASTPPTCTVDSEHEPRKVVVTPWRTDSSSGGSLEHLDVVVRVDVDHPRQDPPVGRVHDLRAAGRVERLRGHRHDPTVADAEVADRGGGAGAVEPAASGDDGVEGRAVRGVHARIEPD